MDHGPVSAVGHESADAAIGPDADHAVRRYAGDGFAPRAHDRVQHLHAVDAVPEEVGMVRFQVQGLQAMQSLASPMEIVFCRNAAIAGPNRRLEDEKQGTFCSLARRKISMASANEAAIGLSTNSGLPAAITGRAWARCGRPSTLSSSTASTFGSSSSIEPTISTPMPRSCSLYGFIWAKLWGISGLPPGKAATTRAGQFAGRLRVVEHLRELDGVRCVQADDAQFQRAWTLGGKRRVGAMHRAEKTSSRKARFMMIFSK